MKRLMKALTVLVLLTVLLVGCAAKNEGTTTTTEKKGQAAMIIPIPKGDPFITLAFSGVEKLATEKGIEAKLVEALDKSEYSEQIRAMSEEGASPIYVMWDDLAEEVFKVAKDFPDTNYIIVDCYATSELKNVKTITVEPQQSSFIAGFVAANLSESKKVAFLGSMQMPVIDRFRAGFEAGVAHANNGTTCESLYIGGADDPNKAAELTKQVVSKGADVVMHAANKAGLGVIQAAEEMNVKAIGADEWQGDVGKTVVWSALKDISGAVYEAGLSSVENKFVGGYQEYNINSGISLFDTRDYENLPQDIKTKVDEVVKDLKDGKIVVPTELK